MLIDPPTFSEEFRNDKSSKLQNLIGRESPNKKPNMSRIDAATRLSRLWKASAAANCVTAVLKTDGTHATDPLDVLDTLRSGWFGTFSRPSPPTLRPTPSFAPSNPRGTSLLHIPPRLRISCSSSSPLRIVARALMASPVPTIKPWPFSRLAYFLRPTLCY